MTHIYWRTRHKTEDRWNKMAGVYVSSCFLYASCFLFIYDNFGFLFCVWNCIVPEGPPLDVECEASSSRSLRLRWTPPIHSVQNGHIVGYKVHYHLISRSVYTAHWPMVLPPPEFKRVSSSPTNINGLIVFGNYSVRVSAYTRKGNGVSSLPIFCNTAPEGKYSILLTIAFFTVYSVQHF